MQEAHILGFLFCVKSVYLGSEFAYIAESNRIIFVEFLLDAILETVRQSRRSGQASDQASGQASDQVKRLVVLDEGRSQRSRCSLLCWESGLRREEYTLPKIKKSSR